MKTIAIIAMLALPLAAHAQTTKATAPAIRYEKTWADSELKTFTLAELYPDGRRQVISPLQDIWVKAGRPVDVTIEYVAPKIIPAPEPMPYQPTFDDALTSITALKAQNQKLEDRLIAVEKKVGL
jgi:hypothetical protein